jgi:hypothetical protein
MDAHGRSNGGRAMIMTMVGRWVRVTVMLPHAVLTLSHLGHPNGVIFVVLASLLTLQA